MITDLPITRQLKNYNREKFQADVLAGFTVAVTLIPQGLAYGSLARLPVQYGLYSGFIGGFIYLLFGTAKDITLGPTAIMSLFVAQYCNGSIALATALTFYAGLVLVFAFAFLGIGGCISDFISHHVITGFCSAASFITTITQIPKVLGLHTKSSSPIGILTNVYKDLEKINTNDFVMGLFCIATLTFMKFLPTICKNYFNYDSPYLKIVSTARNAILAFSLAIMTFLTCREDCKYTLIAIDVEKGQGGIQFHEPDITYESFIKLAKSGALVIIPFMGFLESISIARTFGKVFDYRPDEFWESFSIGMSNIIGSFFGSFPVTGSFSRTALNASTGVQTTFGGVITSVIVIIALEFMLSVFHFIPKASLGAIIICAAINMFEPAVLSHLFKLVTVVYNYILGFFIEENYKRIAISTDKKEESLDSSLACVVTFIVCFYGLAIGIMLGLGVSIASILYKVSHPNITYQLHQNTLTLKSSTDTLSYSSCNHIYNKVQEILIMTRIFGLDGTLLQPKSTSTSDKCKNIKRMKKLDKNISRTMTESVDTIKFSDSENSLVSSEIQISNEYDNLISKTKIQKVIINLQNVTSLDHDVLVIFQDFKRMIEIQPFDNNGITLTCLILTNED